MLNKSVYSLCKFPVVVRISRRELASLAKSRRGGQARAPQTGPKGMGYAKPLLFGAVFGIGSYATCTIWEYEKQVAKAKNRARYRSNFFDDDDNDERGLTGSPWFYGLYRDDTERRPVQKRGDFRRKANSWWNSLTTGQKTVLAIVAANAGVLVFLRVALVTGGGLTHVVRRYFLLSPTSSLASLVGSTFSHYSVVHFGMNMYVLWSLAPFAHVMGQPQFTAFYLTSGVLANVASIIYRQMPFHKVAVASLGASGCLYAVVGALCVKFPHVEFGVPLLSDIFPALHFKAEALWPALLTFDAIGLVLGLRLFDHVAHMSGLLFGVWYAKMGEKWLWSRNFRQFVVTRWRRIRPASSDND